MGWFKISDRDLAETLFALCLQADAAFESQLHDALSPIGVNVTIEQSTIDHRELLIFYVWMAHRMMREHPKVLNSLQSAYFIASVPVGGQTDDGQQLFQLVNQRFYEYDQAMANAADPLDIVYVARPAYQRILAHSPELLVHGPRLEIIVTHLFTEWIVSASRAVKELV